LTLWRLVARIVGRSGRRGRSRSRGRRRSIRPLGWRLLCLDLVVAGRSVLVVKVRVLVRVLPAQVVVVRTGQDPRGPAGSGSANRRAGIEVAGRRGRPTGGSAGRPARSGEPGRSTRAAPRLGAGVSADLDDALEVDVHRVRELEGLETEENKNAPVRFQQYQKNNLSACFRIVKSIKILVVRSHSSNTSLHLVQPMHFFIQELV
jgi:hypothetical protein